MRYINLLSLLSALLWVAPKVVAETNVVASGSRATNLLATVTGSTNAPAEPNAKPSKAALIIENLSKIEAVFKPKEDLKPQEAILLSLALTQTKLGVELATMGSGRLRLTDKSLREPVQQSHQFLSSVYRVSAITFLIQVNPNKKVTIVIPNTPQVLVWKTIQAEKRIAELQISSGKYTANDYSVLLAEAEKNLAAWKHLLVDTYSTIPDLRPQIEIALGQLKKEADDPAHLSQALSETVDNSLESLKTVLEAEKELQEQAPKTNDSKPQKGDGDYKLQLTMR